MILRLKNAGDEATLDIVKAEVVTGEYGQQVRFDAANGDTLYVPESSVLRQLDRCKVAEIGELSGTTLHFYRAPNSKKGGSPWWNIDAAREGDVKTPSTNGKPVEAAKPAPPKVVPGGPEDKDYADALVGMEKKIDAADANEVIPPIWTKHGRAYFHVLNEYVPAAKKAGVEIDVSALTFQLFKSELDAR